MGLNPVHSLLKVAIPSFLLAACSALPQQIAAREFDNVAGVVSVGADMADVVGKLRRLGYECGDAMADAPGGYVNFKHCGKLAAGGFPKCTIALGIDMKSKDGRVQDFALNSTGSCQ